MAKGAVNVNDMAVNIFCFHDFDCLPGRNAQTHDVGVEDFSPFFCVPFCR
jgi:hypothetical protein